MKFFKIFFITLFPLISFAQIQGEDEVYLKGDRVEAIFDGGGIEKFNEYVNKFFDYSKVKKPGRIVAKFTIDIDGSIKNIKLIEFIDIESATEIIRVLNECPKWIPAKRGGKPIAIEINYPMVFKKK